METKSRLDAVLGDSSPSFPTVSFSVSEFKRGHTDKSDEPCSGRPKTATTTEIVDKIHDMVLDDHRIQVSKVEHTVGIC